MANKIRDFLTQLAGPALLLGGSAGVVRDLGKYAPPLPKPKPLVNTPVDVHGGLQKTGITVQKDARGDDIYVIAPKPAAAKRAWAAAMLPSQVDGLIEVVSNQAGQKLRLKATPGAAVEVVNLTSLPGKRLYNDETQRLGFVDANGDFEGAFSMHQGDYIRVRLQLPDGSRTDWKEFRADGLGADTDNSQVAMFRIGLTAQANNVVDVRNINTGRPISEPNATLRFVNQRTQEVRDFVMTQEGEFPERATLAGQPGDVFSVRVSDGVNNLAFEEEVGLVEVSRIEKNSGDPFDLSDPTLLNEHLDQGYGKKEFVGPLIDAAGINMRDPEQGVISNCFTPAAFKAIAFHMANKLADNMREIKTPIPGTDQFKKTFQFRFYRSEYVGGGKSKSVPEWSSPVDADLYVRTDGTPLYGSDDGDKSPENMELWYPLYEKAYNAWLSENAGRDPTYEATGSGGHPSTVFRHILGREATSRSVAPDEKEAVWRQLTTNARAKLPMAAGTHEDDAGVNYTNTGVYGDHAYSVLRIKTVKGVRMVELQNPWNESEPTPGDGVNDGRFWLPLEDFCTLFSDLFYVVPPKK